ncbi:hypothetical protein MIMGU_mgv1a018589mg, partial [Erythranthe guttata]
MAPPAWLLPLNSHPNSITHVKIRESETSPLITKKPPPDANSPSYVTSTLISSPTTTYGGTTLSPASPSKQQENHPTFHCGGGGAALSGEDELARKLLDFVLLVDGKPENADRDSVAATLDIDRAVFVPEEEFRWWVSWFDEQRRVCPNFNLEYRRAIGKPRGRTEAVRKTAGRSLAGEIESVAVEAECSICLEEFSEGARVVQLPCRHMFDEDCILRWLSENR